MLICFDTATTIKLQSVHQDTLYLHQGHDYLKGCDIEGSVDFICGDAAARFEDCSLHCKSDGWITAQKRSSDLSSTVSNDSSTGFVFQGYDHNIINGMGFCLFVVYFLINLTKQRVMAVMQLYYYRQREEQLCISGAPMGTIRESSIRSDVDG